MGQLAEIHVVSAARPEADLLAVGCFEGEAPAVDGLEEASRRAAERLAARGGWRGKEEQVAQTEARPDGPVVSLYGLGARGDFSFQKLARWLNRAAEDARQGGARRVAVVLPAHQETAGRAAGRVLRALALSVYRYDRYQSERNGRVEQLSAVPPAAAEAAYRAALPEVLAVAEAVAFARDLANSPANEATPTWMEERARELAEKRGLKLTVLDAGELAARGMGGLLAVGAGSAHAPRLVRLEWGSSGPQIALVGKGVTFDTGGISIKPAADMDEMKYDKSGACAVLAVARAVADLELPVRLSVFAPLVENMLSASSYRPSDIVRCYNGKTVEITNTDAEGRMILADALAWAAEDRPDALLELSTLTGACVVALGHQAAGLFTPDDGLAAELTTAAEEGGERLWRLPLYPEFLEEMKGTHADLRNAAGRWGGAGLAAAFLSQFVGDMKRWAHLDIAGVANVKPDNGGGASAGATGFGVASTVSWLRRLAG
ncbi:MAG TPA: leucyl aminopeptidase [Thermoanaerobaculia bacterium]|jgi:leucyl aminopeptidase|nr:leucyl aminopeptidase [Thermoanaerobaculia bacterium]